MPGMIILMGVAENGPGQGHEKGPDGLVVGRDGLARPPWAAHDPLLQEYYDTEWGRPVTTERGLFERLSLEAFQSGLSWATILRKRENFRRAFDDFEADVVAAYTDADRKRLMADAGIVRNRLKIEATITNARATVALRDHGGLVALIARHAPTEQPRPRTMAEVPTQSAESRAMAAALKRAGFTFVGPTTMFALMEAVGLVNTHVIGSHRRPA